MTKKTLSNLTATHVGEMSSYTPSDKPLREMVKIGVSEYSPPANATKGIFELTTSKIYPDMIEKRKPMKYEYEYEDTFEIGNVEDACILDRVITGDGSAYVMKGTDLFVNACDPSTRVRRSSLEQQDLKIQRIKSQPVGDFKVGDHFVNPRFTTVGFALEHFRVLSTQELDDMFLVECVQLPIMKLHLQQVQKIACAKDAVLYPAHVTDV